MQPKSTNSMSDRSARSLGRASAKAMLNLPQALLDGLDHAIRKDDVEALRAGLGDGNLEEAESPSQSMLLNLLQRSISARAKGCIGFLLGVVKSLDEPDDINERNCIHRLIVHIGRNKSATMTADQEASSYPFPQGTHYAANYLTPAVSPLAAPRLSTLKESSLDEADGDRVQLLVYILDHLRPDQRAALSARDSYGACRCTMPPSSDSWLLARSSWPR